MIEFYKIKTESNNKVLYLYLNYDYEFGKDINDKVFKSIKTEIDIFNIAKIVLIIGGITFSTIYVKDNYNYLSPTNNNTITENMVISDYEEIKEIQVLEKEIVNGNIEENEVINDEIITNNIIKDNDIIIDNNLSNTNKKPTNISRKESSNSTITQNINKENTSNIIYVKVKRSNGEIINIELEEYIIGVVAAEMPASFPVEALKSQAVVARTYALKKINKGETLTDTSSTQNYKDINQMKEMWGTSFNTYYNKIVAAVNDTKGETLVYKGEYIDAVYHSTSNGYTEDAVYVWGNNIPYLKSVSSPWDKSVSTYSKEVTLNFFNILDLLGIDYKEDIKVEVVSRNSSGRITEVKIGNYSCTGVAFRNLLGLRSADFDIELKEGNVIVTTKGYGHGVGMSQYGASGMAKEGYTYKQILLHYYTGVTLKA